MTSLPFSGSRPYFLKYAGASSENDAGGVIDAGGAVVGRIGHHQAREARVLELLDPYRHRHVVGARGDRVAGLAQRLGTGRAHILDAGHGLVLNLERLTDSVRPETPEPIVPSQ